MEVKSGSNICLIILGPDIENIKFNDARNAVVKRCNSDDEYEEVINSEEFKNSKFKIFLGHGNEKNAIKIGGNYVGILDILSLCDDGLFFILGCEIGSGIKSKKYNSIDEKIESQMKPNSILVICAGKYDTFEAVNKDIIQRTSFHQDPIRIGEELAKFPQTSKIFMRGEKDVTYLKLHDPKPKSNLSREDFAQHIATQMMNFKIAYENRNLRNQDEIDGLITNPKGEYLEYRDAAKKKILSNLEIIRDYIKRSLMASFAEGKIDYLELYLSYASGSTHDTKNNISFVMNGDDLMYLMRDEYTNENPREFRDVIMALTKWGLENQPEVICKEYLPFICDFINRKINKSQNIEGISVHIDNINSIISHRNIYLFCGGFDSEEILSIFRYDDKDAKDEKRREKEVSISQMQGILKAQFFLKIGEIIAKKKLSNEDIKILYSVNDDNLLLIDSQGNDLIDMAASNHDALRILVKQAITQDSTSSAIYSLIMHGNHEIFCNLCKEEPEEVSSFLNSECFNAMFFTFQSYGKDGDEKKVDAMSESFLKLIPDADINHLYDFLDFCRNPQILNDEKNQPEENGTAFGGYLKKKRDDVISEIMPEIEREIEIRVLNGEVGSPRSEASAESHESLSQDRDNEKVRQ